MWKKFVRFVMHLFKILPSKRGNKNHGRQSITDKLPSPDQMPLELEKPEIALLLEETGRMTLGKNSWLWSLCFSSCLCPKNKRMRLQEKAAQ